VHLSRIIWLLPTSLQALTASSISESVAIPVEIIIGFFFFAAYSISGTSVISKEAIL